MLTIIYAYRNRDLQRVKNSLESLNLQTVKDFEVRFVDYGSKNEMSMAVKDLCRNYSFITYSYHPTRYQPWNKSKALNSVIKNLETQFCFVADVDIIFNPEFVEKALSLLDPRKAIYFQVGFLNKNDNLENATFHSFKKYRKSKEGATGLALFPVKALKVIRGFDEFFHWWGSEDTDVLERLKKAGSDIEFFDKELLLLHQWHLSYRNSESKKLTQDLRVKGIVQVNHQHLKNNKNLKKEKVNSKFWGASLQTENVIEMQEFPVTITINNQKENVDDILFGQMPSLADTIFKVCIVGDPAPFSIKQMIKKKIGKKTPEFYSLKEVNDKVLLHLISYYRDFPYYYKTKEDLKEIEFSVDFRQKIHIDNE